MLLKNKYFYAILFVVAVMATGILFESSPKKQRARNLHVSSFAPASRADQIKIEIGNIAYSENANQPVVIKANVYASKISSDLEYRWFLGENVVLVDGVLKGSVTAQDGKATLEILIRGFTNKENRHVSLHVTGLKDGQRIVTERLVASKPESTFEHIVKNVEKIKAEEK